MWAFHNSLKGWTLYDLTLEQAQVLMNSLTPNEKRLLKVNEVTSQKWVTFNSEIHKVLVSSRGQVSSHFSSPVDSGHTQSADTDFFIVKAKKVIYPRLHERFNVEADAAIELGQKQFKTTTVDISEGGLYFKDVLPDWVSGYFIVTLTYHERNYQVMCSMVEDQKLRHRVQIVSEESDSHYLRFKSFLDSLKK